MASEGFGISQRAATPAVTIRRRIPATGIPGFFDEAFPALFGYVMAQGAMGDGPPFARYHEMGDVMDMEAGIPTSRALAGDGAAIAPAELPGGSIAAAMHVGPYDRLHETYAALMAWLAKHGRRPCGPMWESYLTDPTAEPDPEKWRTEVCVPVE
ncbi:MAG: GyrI-like domain-containing protein [Dehalococcoidia bacterium]